MRQALGLVEAIGLATAIEAADAAVKSANVTLVGLEPAKGNGMHTIKLLGDVGAVKAGVEAASVACDKGRGVFSVKVIPRPDSRIDALIANDQTLGIDPDILKKNVCSPGGTTIEGVCALEQGGMPAAVIDAAMASLEKDKKLQNS